MTSKYILIYSQQIEEDSLRRGNRTYGHLRILRHGLNSQSANTLEIVMRMDLNLSSVEVKINSNINTDNIVI